METSIIFSKRGNQLVETSFCLPLNSSPYSFLFVESNELLLSSIIEQIFLLRVKTVENCPVFYIPSHFDWNSILEGAGLTKKASVQTPSKRKKTKVENVRTNEPFIPLFVKEEEEMELSFELKKEKRNQDEWELLLAKIIKDGDSLPKPNSNAENNERLMRLREEENNMEESIQQFWKEEESLRERERLIQEKLEALIPIK